jgi:hypothetical protein
MITHSNPFYLTKAKHEGETKYYGQKNFHSIESKLIDLNEKSQH